MNSDYFVSQHFLSVPDARAETSENDENHSDSDSVQYNPELAIPVIISNSNRYDDSRSRTGCAIIFNMEDFQNHKKFKKREGSQVDVDRLQQILTNLNIDVENNVYKNCTYNSMQQKLKYCKLSYQFITKNLKVLITHFIHFFI